MNKVRAHTGRATAILAALVALQGCAPAQKGVFNDPYEQYPLGKVHDCGDIQQIDMRLNHENAASPGFGCAHQSTLSVMVSDPIDLSRPREMTPADEGARFRVLDNYRKGQDTSAAPRARGTKELID